MIFFCARFNRRSIKETKNALFHARSGNGPLGVVKTDQDLLLTLYRLSHHILKTKKPFTLGEEVIKPALRIVAEQLLDKETEHKFQNIPLSDTTVSRKRFHMAEDLLEQLLCCWKISFLIRKLIALELGFIPAFDLGYNSPRLHFGLILVFGKISDFSFGYCFGL